MSKTNNDPESEDDTYRLTEEQKRELDLMDEQYKAGTLKTYTWEEVKEKLINKLKK